MIAVMFARRRKPRTGEPERDPSGTGRRGRNAFERIMFSFMGPPQLGDVNAPITVQPDPAAALCHKCRRPWDEHEIVRTTSMTYATCPTAQT
jgi:hypothetical protein